MHLVIFLVIFLILTLTFLIMQKRIAKKPRLAKIRFEEGLLTGNDNFINIRFKVLKPGYIITGNQAVYVFDEATNERLETANLPKLGRTITKKARDKNHGYLMVFNKNKIIKRGTRVKVVIGNKIYSNIYIN